MQIQQVSKSVPPKVGRHTKEGTARSEAEYRVDVGIVTEQRDILPLRQHGDPRLWMRVPDRTQQWCSEENVPDRAETNHQDIRRDRGTRHREKLQR
jgi:hypothetical protein